MKKKFTVLAIIATIIMAGCSEKNVNPSGSEGKPTYMSISITFPKSGQGTRATYDPNATEEEVAIKSVDIFIYHENGHFLSYHPLNIGMFALAPGTEDRYISSEQISTTTGPKIVYAGINLPVSIVSAVKNQHMGRLKDYVHSLTMQDLDPITNGLPMFSERASNKTFTDNPSDPANHVSIDVKRLVSKITVEKSATMTQSGVQGILGGIDIAVNNFNTKLFLQQGDAPEYKDPNWARGEHTAMDYMNTSSSGYVAAHDLGVNSSPFPEDYNILYAPENTSEGKLKKEITRVTVRSTFMPNEITVVDTDPDDPDGYKLAPRPGTITSPQTFYSVTPGVTEYTRYFYERTVAESYAAATGSNVLTYTDGLCYWDIFLNKSSASNQWDVLRNDYYKCTITKIVAPGRHTPDVTDPNIPPDADTDITADINILFWTPVLEDYVLGQ